MKINEEKLSAYALDELEGKEKAKVEEHLKENEEARRYVDDIRRTAEIVTREFDREPAVGLSRKQKDRIRAASSEGVEPERRQARVVWYIRPASVAAAAILVAAGLYALNLVHLRSVARRQQSLGVAANLKFKGGQMDKLGPVTYQAEKRRETTPPEPSSSSDMSYDTEGIVLAEAVTEFDDRFKMDDNTALAEVTMGSEDAISVGIVDRGKVGYRTAGGRRRAVARGGGDKATESAVDAGLRWLARHQAPDGAWHTNTWSQQCPANDSCVGHGGGRENDTIAQDNVTAISGFAILAFLGAGHTHQTGSFRKTVKDGLGYLMKAQDKDGKFGPGDMYTHGIACLAAVEAYGMTRNKRYKKMAQDGIDYIIKVQNPLGGWNYKSPHSRNDMSVSSWQIMALKSAKVGGLNVPKETIYRVIRWLDIATEESSGDVCYEITGDNPNAKYKGGGGSIRMRAAGMLCHLLFGKDRRDPIMKMSGDVFLKHLPQWENASNTDKYADSVNGADLYYWYYTTLVNFQLGGKYWKAWNTAIKDALLTNQLKGKIHADGSWPPVDQYSDKWSRPGMTALCVLSLEVYYRYTPLHFAREVKQ